MREMIARTPRLPKNQFFIASEADERCHRAADDTIDMPSYTIATSGEGHFQPGAIGTPLPGGRTGGTRFAWRWFAS